MIHEIVSKKWLMKRLQGKGFSLSVRIGTIADTADELNKRLIFPYGDRQQEERIIANQGLIWQRKKHEFLPKERPQTKLRVESYSLRWL